METTYEHWKAERRAERAAERFTEQAASPADGRYVWVSLPECPACSGIDHKTERTERHEGQKCQRRTCRTCGHKFIVIFENDFQTLEN
jgi:hypothetical protein